jgi:hypothetical protein
MEKAALRGRRCVAAVQGLMITNSSRKRAGIVGCKIFQSLTYNDAMSHVDFSRFHVAP